MPCIVHLIMTPVFQRAPSFEAKKYTNDLGLNYEKIDACVNHCVLYRKQYANATECPICHELRCQIRGNDMNDKNSCSTDVDEDSQKKSRVSRLVLRYFPLTARLQRLFMSSKTARHMRWHKNKCYNDDIIRHPRDSLTWKKLDDSYGKEMFHMRASFLWTINDFPAYGYLSGWSICGNLLALLVTKTLVLFA